MFLFSKSIWQKQDRDKGKDDNDDDLENTKKIEKWDKVNKKQYGKDLGCLPKQLE